MTTKDFFAAAGLHFPPTRWPVVAAARRDDSAERALALDVLFTAYWKPVYKYIRLKFSRPPDHPARQHCGCFGRLGDTAVWDTLCRERIRAIDKQTWFELSISGHSVSISGRSLNR
jgi:hypothetical protein